MPEFLPWSSDLTQQAGDRLLAVLSGSSWDRWTLALLETLDDPGVAVALEDFALARVDNDLRPDVSRRLAPSGSATLALLTPAGFPLAATTWAPPRTIREFLTSAAFQWKIRAPLIAAEARKAQVTGMELGTLRPRRGAVDDEFVRACVEELIESSDPIWGGWGGAPKLLNVPALSVLLRRADLAGARAIAFKALKAIVESPMRAESLLLFHESDSSDWQSPSGLILPAENADLIFLNPGRLSDFLPLYSGIHRALLEAKEGAGLPCALRGGERFLSTGASRFSAAQLSSQGPGVEKRALIRPPHLLVSHSVDSWEPLFHLSDQGAALAAFTSYSHYHEWDHGFRQSAETLAAAVLDHFWDDSASAFRDRFGPPLELAPLDTPQYPVEENAIVAGAMARMGGEWLQLAKTCLGSFTDAYVGQGVGAARLALAVQEVVEAERME
ncbi:MAG: hypothetical protein FD180_2845 [Planctomycetota bacterium]|nr:MAG: hypothetical protein FD180_2845 [Planctomycetota bacterium]